MAAVWSSARQELEVPTCTERTISGDKPDYKVTESWGERGELG